jgi:hypothetical protein
VTPTGKWQIVFKPYSGAYNDPIHTPGIVILYESSGKAGGLPRGESKGLSQEAENGKTVYEVETIKNGKPLSTRPPVWRSQP